MVLEFGWEYSIRTETSDSQANFGLTVSPSPVYAIQSKKVLIPFVPYKSGGFFVGDSEIIMRLWSAPNVHP